MIELQCDCGKEIKNFEIEFEGVMSVPFKKQNVESIPFVVDTDFFKNVFPKIRGIYYACTCKLRNKNGIIYVKSTNEEPLDAFTVSFFLNNVSFNTNRLLKDKYGSINVIRHGILSKAFRLLLEVVKFYSNTHSKSEAKRIFITDGGNLLGSIEKYKS